MWLSTRPRQAATPSPSQWRTPLLVVSPYLLWLLVMLHALVHGLANRAFVTRLGSSEYCVIRTGVPGRLSAALVVVLTILTLVFQGLVARRLWSLGVAHRRAEAAADAESVYSVDEKALRKFPTPRKEKSDDERGHTGLMIRMAIFNVLMIGVIGYVAGSLFFPPSCPVSPNARDLG
jgi:hypothetical protein